MYKVITKTKKGTKTKNCKTINEAVKIYADEAKECEDDYVFKKQMNEREIEAYKNSLVMSSGNYDMISDPNGNWEVSLIVAK